MNLFSLLSFLSSIICIYLGFYSLKNYPKTSVSQLFFLISIALFSWAFPYTFVYAASSKEWAMLMIRWAGLGISFWASVNLHFIIELTHKKKYNLTIIYILIYIPAIFFLFYFLFVGIPTVQNVLPGKYGWIEVVDDNSLSFWGLISYYTIYFVISEILLIIWIIRNKKKIIRQQGLIISIALFFTFVFSFGSDIIMPFIGIYEIPAIAPVFFIIWSSALFVAITKLQLLDLSPNAVIEEIVSGIDDFLFFIDIDHRIINVNRQANEALGYELGELATHSMKDIVLEKNKLEEAFIKLSFIHPTPLTVEINLIGKDNNLIPASLSLSPIVTRRKLFGALIIGKDLRQSRQLQFLMNENEKNKMRTHFISSASHEFKNPLSTILLSAETLENYGKQLSLKQKKNYYDNIRLSINQMTALLDDILIIQRSNTGRIKFSPETFNLRDYINELIETQPFATLNNHKLLVDFEGDFSDCVMDKRLIQYIFNNLLSNAVKFSPQKEEVQISLRREKNWAVLQIKDQGIGIAHDELDKLFETFQRGKNVGNIPGTGLGLAIVRDAVKLHNGTIKVESDLGKGTVFIVSLPIK